MSQVNGAEVVAVVEEAEVPAMPDYYYSLGWDPGLRRWCWSCVEEVHAEQHGPGTQEDALRWAAARQKEYGWLKVSVHRVSAPVEGTGLEAAWEAIMGIAAGPWNPGLDGLAGQAVMISPMAEIYYATKDEMRSQYAALRSRVLARLPGVKLGYSHQVMGPGRVRMRCWLSRPAAGSTKFQAPNSK
jgi:hypothetical protein